MKLEFSRQVFERKKNSNFMKIRPVGAKFLHVDGRMDRHDEANSSFFFFFNSVNAPKNENR